MHPGYSNNDPAPGGGWQDFLRIGALSLACLLLASAAICWVAANWAQITAFQKLLGAQTVLAALVLMSWRSVHISGADASGQFSLSANLAGLAAVATGALLALIGQTYQTGADPWELFLLWAMLLIPWLLAMRTVFLAMLCAMLLNTAAVLYLGIYDSGLWLGLLPSWTAISLLLALLNLGLLASWEYGIDRLDDRWRIGPRVLGAGALAWLVAATMASWSTIGILAVAAAGMLAMALIAWVYLRKRPDLAMVCLAALAAFCQITSLLIRWQSGYDLLLVIVLLVGLAGWGLRHLGGLVQRRQHAAHNQGAVRLPREPWFLTLLRLAVVVITASLAVFFLFMVLDLQSGSIWILGLVLGASGLWAFRASPNGIRYEMGTTLTAAGLLLIGIDLVSMDEVHALIRATAMLTIGCLLYIFATNAALRFLCAVFGLGIVLILTWPGQGDYGLLDLFEPDHIRMSLPVYLRLWWLAVAAILTVILGARSRNAAFWAPLAWGLVSLTQLMTWFVPAPALFGLAGAWHPALISIWLGCAVLPVLLLAVFLWLRRDVPNALRLGAPAVLAVASLGWMGASGIAMALAWIILGYGMAKRSLLVFGILALLAYLARFYYMLESSLLQKSWVLGLTGAWLLLSWLVMHRAARRSALTQESCPEPEARPSQRPWRTAGLAVGLLLVLLVANTGIYQREQILATGQRVVLALAPVDPRSLIQGDYMALNFAVADQVSSALEQAPTALAEQIKAQRGGYLVLQPDERGVHQLATITAEMSGPTINASSAAIALAFRLRGNGIRIVTDAWFFPEGQAAHFERARYGEFRVDDTGQGLLTRMLDEQLQVLSPVDPGTPADARLR